MFLQRVLLASLGVTAVFCSTAAAQPAPPTILTIEMENVVRYNENYTNPQKNGTSAVAEAQTATPATFYPGTFIGDIVAVNGQKSKGTVIAPNFTVGLTPSPTGSQGIADVNRIAIMTIFLEIQQADGTSVGTLYLSGSAPGPPPVGAPKAGAAGNFAVLGGTGAFLGARGQAATILNSHRSASTLENPINRRTFPAGLWKLIVQLIPMTTPEVILTTSGLAIVHGDYSLVTASQPARAGEVLTLFASGLGSTRPGIDPGQMFPSSPAQLVNSPIDVLVNGKAGEVIYAGGYPNAVNDYQVNFRVPEDTVPGMASIQLSAAWIVGAAVRVPVR